MKARIWLTRIHRWTGLGLVLFLVIVGFTGALLPFQHDIQHWLAPESERVVRVAGPNTKPLDWPTLAGIAERRSGGVVGALPLERHGTEPAVFGVSPRAGRSALGFDTIVLDPYTGRVIAIGDPAASGAFAAKIMPFLYDLHCRLALGDWGAWLLGLAALAWSLDCFVGFYLTLPATRRGWWRNWRQAWKLRLPPRTAFRFNFDLHRAAGLWLWPMLFIFAWSSVGMNLNSVFDPVMRTFFDYQTFSEPSPAAKQELQIGWAEALSIARTSATSEAGKHGVTIERERGLSLDRETGRLTYTVRSSRDLSTDYANTWFFIDGHSRRVIGVDYPTGEHGGNTVAYWLSLLHTAGVFGLPYRIFVSLIGVVVVTLSVTGVLIWMKKRSARLLDQSRARRLSRTAQRNFIAAE